MSKGTQVKLKQLLDLIDYNRESTIERLQICRPNSSWDECDEVSTGSALLLPLYEAVVNEIEAVEPNVIRISIDWDALNLYGWANGKGETTG